MILSCIVACSHDKIEIEIYFVMLSRKKWCVTQLGRCNTQRAGGSSSAVQTWTRSEPLISLITENIRLSL